MKQAAALLGVPIKDLKAAKSAGCPAFCGSRVDLDAYQDWRVEHPTAAAIANDKDGEQTKLFRLRAERIQFDLDQARGKFFDRSEVVSKFQNVCQRAQQIWIQIPNLAPQLTGRPVPEIQKMLTEAVDRGLAEMQKLLS